MINPYDIVQLATNFKTAVEMPKEERQARMHALRGRVMSFRTSEWAENFLKQLSLTPPATLGQKFDNPVLLAKLIAREPMPLKVMLDYDGTLFPIVKVAASAIPDHDLRKILIVLSKVCDLHIVSGRPMHELKSWFAGLPIQLHAEHGAVNDNETSPAIIEPAETAKLEKLSQMLEFIAGRFPGAHVETKVFSVCFHYRNCNNQDAVAAVSEVRDRITEDFPCLEILDGKKAVEVRFPKLNKGTVITHLLKTDADITIVAIGDDRTDEDMFKAVPKDGFSIVVGGHASAALYRLRDCDDVRLLLNELSKYIKNPAASSQTKALTSDRQRLGSQDRSLDFLSL